MLRGVLLQTFKCGMEADYVLCLLLLLLFIFARAAKEGLSVTLMERLVKLYGSELTTTLTLQYR